MPFRREENLRESESSVVSPRLPLRPVEELGSKWDETFTAEQTLS